MESPVDAWERTLTELVSTRGPALKRYAFLLCGSSAEADDLVQEALVRTFRRQAAVELSTVEAYVRKIMLNIFLDSARRRRRWTALAPRVATDVRADDHELRVAQRHDLAAAIATLSPRQRACVVLRYYDDLPLPAIADQLGVGEGAVKRYLHEARSRLADHLDGYDTVEVARDQL